MLESMSLDRGRVGRQRTVSESSTPRRLAKLRKPPPAKPRSPDASCFVLDISPSFESIPQLVAFVSRNLVEKELNVDQLLRALLCIQGPAFVLQEMICSFDAESINAETLPPSDSIHAIDMTVQSVIAKLLYSWVTSAWLPSRDDELLAQLQHWLQHAKLAAGETVARDVLALIEDYLDAGGSDQPQECLPPPPIVLCSTPCGPFTVRDMLGAEHKRTELARQLTLMVSAMFNRITPQELVRLLMLAPEDRVRAWQGLSPARQEAMRATWTSYEGLTGWMEKVHGWILHSVIGQPDRAEAVEHMELWARIALVNIVPHSY